jgi:GT2 family glycosyltransferase
MNEEQKILSVPEGVSRPLWSVMIPVCNRTKYVRQAVESVLAQDPGPDKLQICVVDNSTVVIYRTTVVYPKAIRRNVSLKSK